LLVCKFAGHCYSLLLLLCVLAYSYYRFVKQAAFLVHILGQCIIHFCYYCCCCCCCCLYL